MAHLDAADAAQIILIGWAWHEQHVFWGVNNRQSLYSDVSKAINSKRS